MEHEIGETEGERLAQAHAVGKHEGIKEGRLSAFKEMRDWAREKGNFYDAERLQHLMGSPDEVIAHAKLRQYEIMEEFAEARLKEK
jgi:hypothetical protein